MAEEKKSSSKSTDSKPAKSESSSSASEGSKDAWGNGKGDSPRNIFTETFRDNYDGIDWSK